MIVKLGRTPYYYTDEDWRSLYGLKDELMSQDSTTLETFKQHTILIPTEFT